MYIIRGNFFGYSIASSYSCSFFLAMLLVQVPTPSFIVVSMFLIGDANIFIDPFWSPTLPLLVLVAFCMRYIFWQRVGKATAAKFFAMRTSGRVDIRFIQIPDASSP